MKTIVSLIFIFCQLSYANHKVFSANQLINNALKYDKTIVSYKGEVIGDVFKRGEFAWLNVNDGTNTLGIWCPFYEVGRITYLGNYKTIGDTIQIEGVFNRACLEHGGELDLHAMELKVIKVGYKVERQIDEEEIILIIIIILLIVLLIGLNLRIKKNEVKL